MKSLNGCFCFEASLRSRDMYSSAVSATAKHCVCVCVRACMCLRAYVNSEVNVFTFGVDVCQMRLLDPLPLSCLLPRCNKV